VTFLRACQSLVLGPFAFLIRTGPSLDRTGPANLCPEVMGPVFTEELAAVRNILDTRRQVANLNKRVWESESFIFSDMPAHLSRWLG
jgi:hypothetical protein